MCCWRIMTRCGLRSMGAITLESWLVLLKMKPGSARSVCPQRWISAEPGSLLPCNRPPHRSQTPLNRAPPKRLPQLRHGLPSLHQLPHSSNGQQPARDGRDQTARTLQLLYNQLPHLIRDRATLLAHNPRTPPRLCPELPIPQNALLLRLSIPIHASAKMGRITIEMATQTTPATRIVEAPPMTANSRFPMRAKSEAGRTRGLPGKAVL